MNTADYILIAIIAGCLILAIRRIFNKKKPISCCSSCSSCSGCCQSCSECHEK